MRVVRAWLSPWVDMESSPEPFYERATQMSVLLVSPLQGFVFLYSCTQGGAPRLRRYALPWANLWLPLRGESERRPNAFRTNWLQ